MRTGHVMKIPFLGFHIKRLDENRKVQMHVLTLVQFEGVCHPIKASVVFYSQR